MNSRLCFASILIFVLLPALSMSKGLPPLSKSDQQRVESLLQKMTLEEKIGQLTLLTSDWDTTGPTVRKGYQEDIKKGKVGAIFNAYTAAFTRKLQKIAVEETRLGIPLLFGYDVIHGHRTIFPISLGEAASWDLKRIEGAAHIAAKEAAAEGLHWTFAPMVDICRDPRWGRISEGAGEDVYLASLIARARVRGIQGNSLKKTDSLLACVKHFAAYGAAQAGRDYNTVDISHRTLHEPFLPPFEAALDEGAASVMTAFNELNGVPATANKMLLTDLLRKQYGFRGFVVTDYTSINELIPHGFASSLSHAGQLAINAGVDMDMQGSVFKDNLLKLVAKGKVKSQRINEAARRVLEAKAHIGILRSPYRYSDEGREKRSVMTLAHRNFARDFARRCIVLLRNSNSILPLRNKKTKIALVGPLANSQRDLIGSWSAAGDWKKAITVKRALEDSGRCELFYAKGCEIKGNSQSDFTKALSAARRADVIVAVMGEDYNQSGEAACRTNLQLPGQQQKLLKELKKTGKPLLLVVMSGRPLALTWENDNVDAILQTWFLGTMAGPAIADILFGVHNPSARMPVTTPRNVGQVPIHYDVKNTGRPISPQNPFEKYKSNYLDTPNTPLFPFGYGLSFTTFQYKNLKLSHSEMSRRDKLKVTVEVKNTGSIDGEEVVQLYLRDHVGSVTRPLRQLKGFKRIKLKSGEKRRVDFTITNNDFQFLKSDMTIGSEAGLFTVYVGPNSAEGLSASFELKE